MKETKPQIKHIVKLCSTLFLTPFFFSLKQVTNIFIQSMCHSSGH